MVLYEKSCFFRLLIFINNEIWRIIVALYGELSSIYKLTEVFTTHLYKYKLICWLVGLSVYLCAVDELKSFKERKRGFSYGLYAIEQVTRGYNIVADGWAGASNAHPHTNPNPHTLK